MQIPVHIQPFSQISILRVVGFLVTLITLASCDPTSRTFYPDGKLKATYLLEKGKIHGLYEEYYPSGAIKEERTYVHGELTGLFKQYYENGRLSMKTEYLNGLKHGASITYYYNGKRFSSSTFKNGVKVGQEFQYDTTGVCRSRNLFDSTGNLLFHQSLFPEKYSRVHPVVRIDSHTIDIGKHCRMFVAFGYDLHGEIAFKIESLDMSSAPPIASIDADTTTELYHLKLHFEKAGRHNIRLTIIHRQSAADTLVADGVSKDFQVVVTDENAKDI